MINDPSFRFAFGFAERYVSDVSLNGTCQEPWPAGECPTDCLSQEALLAWLQEKGTKL